MTFFPSCLSLSLSSAMLLCTQDEKERSASLADKKKTKKKNKKARKMNEREVFFLGVTHGEKRMEVKKKRCFIYSFILSLSFTRAVTPLPPSLSLHLVVENHRCSTKRKRKAEKEILLKPP